jgi:N-acetyl-anhydromuramyl-L-alanine amidase AmpD
VSDTIAYDKPVKDFIAGLDATGHVTHRSYAKKSVTFHHNGGRLSLEGILNVWKTRPASAHFQVDRSGAIGQYVRVHEYAWATGNTTGNVESISIEMANATLSPRWEILDVTWKNAARLAGWLFANVIEGHPRPSNANTHVHHYWKSTDCAGPYIDSIWSEVLAETQRWYEHFRGGGPQPNLTIATKAVVYGYAGTPMRVTDSFYADARQVLAWGARLPGQPVRPEWRDRWVSEMSTFKFADAGKTYTYCLMQLMDYFGIDEDLHNVLELLRRMKLYGYSIISYEGKTL